MHLLGRDKLWVVEWLDDDWPDSLKRALLKLWDMYEKSRHGRVKDNLDRSIITYLLVLLLLLIYLQED